MRLPTRFLLAVAAAFPLSAAATDVTVIGLFKGKAVVTIDRGSPKTLSVGEKTPEGVVLISVDSAGATLVSLPVAEAQRLGINYLQGTPGYSQLADGRRVVSYRVILESVMVGDITLYNVDGVVQGGGEPLLGMSFLSRTEMRNDGQRMVLTKRY